MVLEIKIQEYVLMHKAKVLGMFFFKLMEDKNGNEEKLQTMGMERGSRELALMVSSYR